MDAGLSWRGIEISAETGVFCLILVDAGDVAALGWTSKTCFAGGERRLRGGILVRPRTPRPS
jgi:hypothetical protein